MISPKKLSYPGNQGNQRSLLRNLLLRSACASPEPGLQSKSASEPTRAMKGFVHLGTSLRSLVISGDAQLQRCAVPYCTYHRAGQPGGERKRGMARDPGPHGKMAIQAVPVGTPEGEPAVGFVRAGRHPQTDGQEISDSGNSLQRSSGRQLKSSKR